MSNIRPFIPKDDQNLPDSYGMTIHFISGKTKEFELAQHRIDEKFQLIEAWTIDDIHVWTPLTSIAYIEFDKNFSKLVAIREEHDRRKKSKTGSV